MVLFAAKTRYLHVNVVITNVLKYIDQNIDVASRNIRGILTLDPFGDSSRLLTSFGVKLSQYSYLAGEFKDVYRDSLCEQNAAERLTFIG